MTDWYPIDNPPQEFRKVLLARRPLRQEWAYGVGQCLKEDDGKVRWIWTGSGEPTHWAPITPPQADHNDSYVIPVGPLGCA